MNLATAAACLLAVAAGPALADEAGHAVYPALVRGCAWVVTPGNSRGSAWLVDRPGRLLITNYHVVGDHDRADLYFPAADESGRIIAERAWYLDHRPQLEQARRLVRARVLHRDRDRDLALLEAEALPDEAAALPLAAEPARPGSAVHSIGNRRDVEALWVYAGGVVRQVHRTAEGYYWQGRKLAAGARVVTTQAPLNEGDSGGPVVNAAGEVVAVAAAVQWKIPLAGVAVDVGEVRAFLAAAGRAVPAAAGGRPPEATAALYRRLLASVAWVRTDASSRSTGWLLDRPRRLLVVALPAVIRQDRVQVFFPAYDDGELIAEADHYLAHQEQLTAAGRVVRGCVLARDPRRQLALVELESLPEDAAALPLAATSPQPGDRVHGLGNPTGVEALWLFATGAVRQTTRAALHPPEPDARVRVVLAQLPIHNGDRGGPLVNDAGQLVGVLGSKESPQQLVSYCVEVAEVREFVTASRPMWSPADAAEALRRGQVLMRAGWYDAAVAAYSAGPGDPSAALLAARADAQRWAGHPGRALADADRAVRLDPRLPDAWAARAAAFNALGQTDRALADCATALRLEPASAAALVQRAAACRQLGRRDAARTALDEAQVLDPGLAEAWWLRGLLHSDAGDIDRALADVTRALELAPFLPGASRLRAELYEHRGQEKWAVADWDRALDADPDDVLAYVGRARGHQRRGDGDRAREDRWRAAAAAVRILGKFLQDAVEAAYAMDK